MNHILFSLVIAVSYRHHIMVVAAPLKVIGLGYGRTGTDSLLSALLELGFGPTYHMREALFEEQGISTKGHFSMFKKAAEGESIDWDLLFKNFNSAVDHPVAAFPDELYNQYPDAKFILTIRNSEKWYQSIQTTICWFHLPNNYALKILKTLPIFPFTRLREQGIMMKPLIKNKIGNKEGLEMSNWCNPINKQKVITLFEKHNAHVKDLIPDDQLLIFETGKNTYEDLATFLDVATPTSSYPHSNSNEEFHKIKMGMSIAAVVVCCVGLLAVFFLTRMVMKKFATKKSKTE